jgi:hypothetical protein
MKLGEELDGVRGRLKVWMYLRKRRAGMVTVEHTESACYRYGGWAHGQVCQVGTNNKGELVNRTGNPVFEKFKMQSGHVAIYKLVHHKYFSNVPDMTEKAEYQLIGYEGVKEINKCSVSEFLEIYCKEVKDNEK